MEDKNRMVYAKYACTAGMALCYIIFLSGMRQYRNNHMLHYALEHIGPDLMLSFVLLIAFDRLVMRKFYPRSQLRVIEFAMIFIALFLIYSK